MHKHKIMSWIDELPNVDDTTKARRDEIGALIEQAEKLKGEAYFKGLTLEADAKRVWTAEQIEAAKTAAIRKGTY